MLDRTAVVGGCHEIPVTFRMNAIPTKREAPLFMNGMIDVGQAPVNKKCRVAIRTQDQDTSGMMRRSLTGGPGTLVNGNDPGMGFAPPCADPGKPSLKCLPFPPADPGMYASRGNGVHPDGKY